MSTGYQQTNNIYQYSSEESIELNELDQFYLGVDAFNQKDFPKAHHIWEHIWKRLGITSNRTFLKPFIMLSVSYQNYESGKNSGGNYLFQKAFNQLNENKNTIEKLIEFKLFFNQLQHSLKEAELIDRFINLKIKRRDT